jgi:GNAT superfamily N-acetyltransferase
MVAVTTSQSMIAAEVAGPPDSSEHVCWNFRSCLPLCVATRSIGAKPLSATDPAYSVAAARPRDLALLPAIELAAARLLVGHAPESVLAEATTGEAFDRARRDGHLWVALAGDRPVGFAHVEVFEAGVAHLDELDVHPSHGRRGLGTRLVAAVCEWAARERFDSVTLSTFRDVPWNMPFYAKLGFTVVPRGALSRALALVVADEARRGLDPNRRVVMRRVLPARPSSGLSVRPARAADRQRMLEVWERSGRAAVSHSTHETNAVSQARHLSAVARHAR